MPNPTAPSAYRKLDTKETAFRQSGETEQWDDLALVVFSATDEGLDTVVAGGTLTTCTLIVASPVPCRLDMHAMTMGVATGGGGIWSAFVRVDAANTSWSETQRMAAGTSATCSWFGVVDVTAGSHTLDIKFTVDALSVAMDFYAKRLQVRRGRPVPSV